MSWTAKRRVSRASHVADFPASAEAPQNLDRESDEKDEFIRELCAELVRTKRELEQCKKREKICKLKKECGLLPFSPFKRMFDYY